MIPGKIEKACLVVSSAEGGSELNAFDNALLKAGIGDVNLVRISSIIPPNVRWVEEPNPLPQGALVPAVYTWMASSKRGERIAVGIGAGRTKEGFGVVMEAKGSSKEEVEGKVRRQIEEAFKVRGLKVEEMRIKSVEHKVGDCGCVVGACIFF